ncbi:MAG TPA: xanthine dehydrogenase family protein molybdopterin-binding subunit [Stellaceae bacterium]|nr:xanthine dehydrogenase family protein molybdopterin-binding subunit [Stellaceae bacterium]
MGQFGMGQPVRRSEDRRFITGAGRYTDDIVLPRQTVGYVLRAPHAHAVIRAIDTAAALAAPGVVGIFTGTDLERDGIGKIPCVVPLKNRDGSRIKMVEHPLLATGRVRHVGDGVAFVVAESAAAAKDAAELTQVDYDVLPAVADTARAAEPGAPLVWDHIPNNLCFDWETGNRKATEAAFARAKHVIELNLINNRLVANSMEPRGALGAYDAAEDRFTLYTSTQGSHAIRRLLAASVFRFAEHRIRVVTPDVGGGFGMKLFLYPEHGLVLYAARKLGRPVKWIGERGESFLSDAQGRDNVTRARLALDADLNFLAVDVETTANLGAYLSNFGTFIPTMAGTAMLAGVYRTPAAVVRVKGVYTNTVAVDAYRGAGRPEANYALERLVDHAARKLGVAPTELRRRNFIPPDAMPFKTVFGMTYDSGEFARNLADALKHADRDGFAARKAQSAARGKLRGFGLSTYIEQCGGGFDEMAEIRFDSSGAVTVIVGSQSSGQGHQTAYAQLVADGLGVPFDQIRVHQGDTDVVGFGRGTGGSRSLPVAGNALGMAIQRIVDKGKKIAAHRLEAAEADIEFADGEYVIAGTDKRVSMIEVAQAAHNPLLLPAGFEPGFDEKAHYLPAAHTFPNGCHVCEVEIDPDTGVTTVLRYVVVDDFGNVVNPLLLAGQIHGGVAQGIGQALIEGCVYDDGGQLVTGSFMDYALPHADDVPAVEFSYNVVPCRTNPLGVKGAGEAGAIGAPPAVINAVVDALAGLGVKTIEMPATPHNVWRAIQQARG